MSGLGIVFEENMRAPELRSTPVLKPEPVSTQPHTTLHTPYTADETLLPPLPESGGPERKEAEFSNASGSNLGGLLLASPSMPQISSSPSSSSGFQAEINTAVSTEPNHDENIFMVPESYALDSSALGNDTPPIAFPSIETQTSSLSSLPSAPTLPATSSSGSNTSPLRRLKSLKNGIRKLSLSRMGSLSSMPSLQTQEFPQSSVRPPHLHSNTDSSQQDNCSSSSGGDSIRSAFSSCATPLTAYGSTPQGPSHTHSSSSGSNGSAPRSRKRAISMSNSMSNSMVSATPPIPSPIVTLSEDLSLTKKNLASIEQNFFDNWLSTSADSATQVSASTQRSHASNKGSDSSDRLASLSTPDDLMEYSIYLSQHKRSVESAYDVSRNRLVSSGWCSSHDIENLNLQRDSSLSQIDSKLLQIEARLNSEFNISFLNNKHMQQTNPRQKCASKAAFSPSLKDLESKCLFFPTDHGNVCQ